MSAIYEVDNEQEYEAELDQCVGVSGYQHWFFLSALVEALGMDFRAFAVEFKGQRLGVLPLLFRRRGPISTANLVPFSCGPLIRGEALRAGLVGELFRGVEPVLRRNRVATARWTFSPALKVNSQDLIIPGFEVSTWDNYVIPGTKSLDDLRKEMSRGRRQSIKKTEAHGVFAEDSSIEEIKHWFPEQVSGVYGRQEILPPYSLAQLRLITERLASHPSMMWRTAKGPDGSPLGMSVSIVGDDRLWGWQMVGAPMRGISVQTLLHWDSTKWCLDRGLAYDIGGVPNEGIRVVKASLGAELETAVGISRPPAGAYKKAMSIYNWGMNAKAKLRSHRT